MTYRGCGACSSAASTGSAPTTPASSSSSGPQRRNIDSLRMLNRQMKRGPLVLAVLCLALSALGPAAASAATVAEGRATFELAPGLLGALRTQEARLVAVKPARGGRNALNFPLAGGRLEKSGAGRLRLQGSLEVTKQGRRARL